MNDRARSHWRSAQTAIESALDDMRLPALYWQDTMPRVTQDLLRRHLGRSVRSTMLAPFDALLAALDRDHPGWERHACDFLLAATTPDDMALWRPVAALLSSRRLGRAETLIGFVEQWTNGLASAPTLDWPEMYRGAQCVLALMGTDTTDTLALWRGALARLCQAAHLWRREPDCGAAGAIFLVFAKLLQHRLLSYEEFAAAARAGSVFSTDHYSGRRLRPPFYQPVLDYLGVSDSRHFRLFYQRLAHEQMDREHAGRWEDIWWLRRLGGRDYFFQALQELEQDPTCLYALHAAKWSFDFGERGAALARTLASFAPRTLMMLALLRDDLDGEIAEALDTPAHPRAMRWVRSSTAAAWTTACARPAWLQEWCARWGEAATEAVEQVWLLGLPPMLSPTSLKVFRGDPVTGAAAEAEAARYALVERFAATHLCPHFTRVSLNLDYADALAGRREEALIARACEDTVTAVRALGLFEGGDEPKRVDLMSAIQRGGTRPARAAAREALDLIARRHGLAGADQLERRQELTLAWSDSGLGRSRSRVWWDLGNYRVKLSVREGRVHVIAYGRRGPLKTIPRAVREHAHFEEILAARRELTLQYGEFRKSLEEAMINQRLYAREELGMLRSNPVFAEMIGQLVLQTGAEFVLGSEAHPGPARIAHPVDLLEAGLLERWQRTIVDERIVQPFKQCFREVYRPLGDELRAPTCGRFAGHPVLVPRAFALLRSRGYSPGRGEARRDWLPAGLQAHFTWGSGKPRLDYHLDAEGRDDPVITGDLRFHRLQSGKPGDALMMGEVPPIIFSETMRDADLVVSLAAAGEMGFNSEQTLHLRLALVRQLARILSLSNVAAPETGAYVIVQGRLATYRVHVGSASVFIEPTGAHLPAPRGEPPTPGYLPFEDADSRTTALLRVIIALSRDHEIADDRFRESLARLTSPAHNP